MLLDHALGGRCSPLGRTPEVVERGGCDVSPVDVTTEEGRLTLTAYVWPDMAARHARLAGALALAGRTRCRSNGPTPRRTSSGWTLAPGHLTVLWHSVMWQYVPSDQQARVTARLAGLGSTASDDAPLVHLFAEPTRRTPQDPHRFWVAAETWPGGGERRFLGQMAPHGLPVVWQ